MNISVIMATYKEPEDMLRQAIESVLKQTYEDFEFLIILDNPENRQHIQIIEEYQCVDQRIRFLINETNMGLARSLNKGIQEAKGDYICRMDADDVSKPDRLRLQKEFLEKEKADLIGGVMQVIDEDGNALYSIRRVPVEQKKIEKALRYNQVIAHPTWFGRKEVFTTLEGYRNIPLCEDYDFTLRAVLKGYKISNLNQIVLNYRMTSQSISRSNLFEQYLYARYITAQYKKGHVADIEEAASYVWQRNKSKTANRYLQANVRFNRMLSDLEHKKFLHFVKEGIIFTFSSLYYLDKVFRFAMATIYSR